MNTTQHSTGLYFSDASESLIQNSQALSEEVDKLAKEVKITLAIETLSGEPIQAQMGKINRDNFTQFRPHPDALQRALERAREIGLEVTKVGRFGVSVKGSAELISEACGEPLNIHVNERSHAFQEDGFADEEPQEVYAQDLFIAPQTEFSLSTKSHPGIEDFVFIPPPIFFSPSAMPPQPNYHHVTSSDIRQILNVPPSFLGDDIKVAVVDTGFYPHPYYGRHGFNYSSQSTPSAPSPHIDNNGHGTAISFNVFATAPKATVIGFQSTNPPQDALEDASDANVDIITCSWGYDRERIYPILQSTILDIISEGKIVLFAAGNGHYAWPGSQPEVISIGGCYSNADSQLEASNYASGFRSNLFTNREIPDVSALCGQRPKAIYILMPTQPNNSMDKNLHGGYHPFNDETDSDDGWVGASGTSSAAPQVAGIVALLLQKAKQEGRTLNQNDIRNILQRSAKNITRGNNAMGVNATRNQPDLATGWGLVDARFALSMI